MSGLIARDRSARVTSGEWAGGNQQIRMVGSVFPINSNHGAPHLGPARSAAGDDMRAGNLPGIGPFPELKDGIFACPRKEAYEVEFLCTV